MRAGSILYIGAFRFPDGDAAGARVLGIGKALRVAGHEVVFGGWQKECREADRQADGSYRFQGFSYCALNELKTERLPRLARLLRYLKMGRHTLEWIQGFPPQMVAGVVCYHAPSLFLRGLQRICRDWGVPLVLDVTEWYHPGSYPGGRLGPLRWDSEFRMRVINREVGNLIVISTALEKYYCERACRVLRVPPLVDLQESKWLVSTRPKSKYELRLVYAGFPGKHDLLGNMVRGVLLSRQNGIPAVFDIYGPGGNDLELYVQEEEVREARRSGAIRLHGRVRQESVPGIVAAADFGVVVRPTDKYAQTGLSTKIVEMLSAGLPVMTTAVSDFTLYGENGKDCIVLQNESPRALAEGIARAWGLSEAAHAEMRQNARFVALKHFDYRNYAALLPRVFDSAL